MRTTGKVVYISVIHNTPYIYFFSFKDASTQFLDEETLAQMMEALLEFPFVVRLFSLVAHTIRFMYAKKIVINCTIYRNIRVHWRNKYGYI